MIKICYNCGAEFETEDEMDIRCDVCLKELEDVSSWQRV